MTNHPRGPAPPTPIRLSEAENRRAVDRIETAERESPFCLCGAAMTAVAHGDKIWLECASQRRSGSEPGLRGLVARISSGLGHTRRVIMELPLEQAA